MHKILFGFSLLLAAFQAHSQYYMEPVIESPKAPATSYTITSGSKVTFRAEEYVLLKSGFYSANGSFFHAYVGGPIVYADLKTELDGSYYTTVNNKIYFKYEEVYNQNDVGVNLNYKIYNHKRDVLQTSSVTKYYGMNYLNIDVKNVSNLTSNGENFYILEVTNDKGESKYLRFKHFSEL